MPGTVADPFSLEPLETIPLAPPPLASVLSQVRFVPVFGIAGDRLGAFQRALAGRYPSAQEEVELAIAVGTDPDKPPSALPKQLWRFSDLEGAWRVTLTTDFVTLETRAYAGHADFFARLEEVLEVVQEFIAPPLVTRVGSRYLQRLSEPEDLNRLDEFIRPEVLGVCVVADSAAEARLNLTTAQYGLAGDVLMLGRWGLVPAGFLTDLGIVPLDRPSWLLDLDTFDERQEPFDAQEIVARALEYSRRQYRFFRWAVEPAFLRRFGAPEELVQEAIDRMGG